MKARPKRTNGALAASSLTLAILLFPGCQGEQPRIGSETNFLTWCTADAQCDGELSCLCGVCTQRCTDNQSCEGTSPEAVCLEVGERTGSDLCASEVAVSRCDATCTTNDDCGGLGEEYRCDRGSCRALAASCVRGETAPNDVLLLGDLFLAETGEVVDELEAIARSAGSLGQAEEYRDFSSTFTTAFGGSEDLTVEYEASKEEGQARVVILNTGGPDALLPCEAPPTLECESLAGAIAGATDLLQQFADDGVEDVLLFFYPEPEDADVGANFDVLRPEMTRVCAEAPVSCHFVDLLPTFSGSEADYLTDGGLLPTSEGARAAAEAIWSRMERECVAQ